MKYVKISTPFVCSFGRLPRYISFAALDPHYGAIAKSLERCLLF